MSEGRHDVLGGGIAGASVAAELAADRAVALIEGEARPGCHSTGRSRSSATRYEPSTIRILFPVVPEE